jgi:Fur family iron response transcriptional regulator
MNAKDTAEMLRRHGIKPSTHRVAIAQYVLGTDSHPSADQVWKEVKEIIPVVSRATVYNTLNLFVRKGLLRSYRLGAGGSVFDREIRRHHHFIDEDSGAIEDIPWDILDVHG